MDLADLVRTMQVIELSAKSRAAAVRALVKAVDWKQEGLDAERVLDQIEERETAARTVVTADFALPHATIDWDGGFRIVVGRVAQREEQRRLRGGAQRKAARHD